MNRGRSRSEKGLERFHGNWERPGERKGEARTVQRRKATWLNWRKELEHYIEANRLWALNLLSLSLPYTHTSFWAERDLRGAGTEPTIEPFDG
jgi:hypothetical protein